MKPDLNELLEFIKFSHDIRKIEREIRLEGNKRENDAEHQFQMAFVALYIIDKNKLKLDKYKCMALGLVHDVIEVYAGDLIVFAPKDDIIAKELREKEAVQKIKKAWPHNITLHELIDEYEARQTPEAKFAYALDKLLPEINNYLYGGKAWKKHGITYDQVKKIKEGKVDVNETVGAYHKQILKLFESQPELFGEKK